MGSVGRTVNSTSGGLTGVGGSARPAHAVRKIGCQCQQAQANHAHDQDNTAGSTEQLDAIGSAVAATGYELSTGPHLSVRHGARLGRQAKVSPFTVVRWRL